MYVYPYVPPHLYLKRTFFSYVVGLDQTIYAHMTVYINHIMLCETIAYHFYTQSRVFTLLILWFIYIYVHYYVFIYYYYYLPLGDLFLVFY